MKLDKFVLLLNLYCTSPSFSMDQSLKRSHETSSEEQDPKRQKLIKEFDEFLDTQKKYQKDTGSNSIQRQAEKTFSETDIRCYLGQTPREGIFDPNIAYIEKFIINGKVIVLLEKKFPIENNQKAFNYSLRIAETTRSVQISRGTIEIFRYEGEQEKDYQIKAFNGLVKYKDDNIEDMKIVWLAKKGNNPPKIYFANVPSDYGVYIDTINYEDKKFNSVKAIKIFEEEKELGINKNDGKLKFKKLPQKFIDALNSTKQ